jgi:hypothetical protein
MNEVVAGYDQDEICYTEKEACFGKQTVSRQAGKASAA